MKREKGKEIKKERKNIIKNKKRKLNFKKCRGRIRYGKKFNRISFFSPLTFWLLIFVPFGEKSLPQNKTYSSQLSHQHQNLYFRNKFFFFAFCFSKLDVKSWCLISALYF